MIMPAIKTVYQVLQNLSIHFIHFIHFIPQYLLIEWVAIRRSEEAGF
jgi:hypothetical protein